MTTCAECLRKPGRHETVSGRMLCDGCYQRLAGMAGAGSAMVTGADPATAVGTGIAASGWAGVTAADPEGSARRREKIAATRGFWRRLWVRVWG